MPLKHDAKSCYVIVEFTSGFPPPGSASVTMISLPSGLRFTRCVHCLRIKSETRCHTVSETTLQRECCCKTRSSSVVVSRDVSMTDILSTDVKSWCLHVISARRCQYRRASHWSCQHFWFDGQKASCFTSH